MSKIPRTTWRNAAKSIALRGKRSWRSEGAGAVIFLLPSFLGLCIFFLIPFIDTVRRSLMNATGTEFVGLNGYKSVIENSAFQLAAQNTARFIAVCVPLLLVLSLLLALMMRFLRPGGKLFKTLYLLPLALPVAGMVLLWNVLFAPNGLLNNFLQSIGAESVDFLGMTGIFWLLIGTYLWKNIGYNMLLWLSGLDGISESLYEAVKVDGGGSLKAFRYVTLPGLMPTLGLVFILSLLNSLKVFREALLVAGSYPPDSIYMLQHLFNNWFANLDIVRLCAASVMLCLALLGIILLVGRVVGRTNE